MKTHQRDVAIGAVCSLIFILIVACGIAFAYRAALPQVSEGSVTQGSEYMSTTTVAAMSTTYNLKSGVGTLGSIVITLTGLATLDIYDGTTTSPTGYTNVQLAHFGASPTVGTYTFDTVFKKGLLYVFGTGTIASTTITYR